MKMNDRIVNVLHSGAERNNITLAVQGEEVHLFPVYFVRMVGENTISIPMTNATGIEGVVKENARAQIIAADRELGFEAYVLEGTARYVAQETDYDLVMAMQNEVPGFPIHGAVVFEIEKVRLVPPP